MDVLISLYKGYGLGDAVQMSAVLRHLRHFRPNWKIDFQAEPGRETVGYGIAHNVFCYGEQYPTDHYDLEMQIVLYDTRTNWQDRPNTRVVSCLHERFGLEWDARFSRYQINLTEESVATAKAALSSIHRPVAFHYQGDSAKADKDLTVKQAESISESIRKFDATALILDWRPDPLPIIRGRTSVRTLGLTGGHDARINCSVISQCKAFVGIDSGPSKCASATDTPALVIWTGHHPEPFHDPASNTTHLVPKGKSTSKFFKDNYSVVYYEDVVAETDLWLSRVLRN